MLGVRCHFFLNYKVVELVGGGSVINGAYHVKFMMVYEVFTVKRKADVSNSPVKAFDKFSKIAIAVPTFPVAYVNIGASANIIGVQRNAIFNVKIQT